MRVVACGERVDEEEDLDDDGDEPEDEALAVEDVHGHVDGLDGAEVGAAAQAEELEDLALEVGLRVKEERGAHGEEEADGNLDDADEGGVEDLEGPDVLEVGEEEEEEENAHGEVGRDDAGQHARQEEDRADDLVGARGRAHVQVLGVAAGLLLQVAGHLRLRRARAATMVNQPMKKRKMSTNQLTCLKSLRPPSSR